MFTLSDVGEEAGRWAAVEVGVAAQVGAEAGVAVEVDVPEDGLQMPSRYFTLAMDTGDSVEYVRYCLR